MCCTPLQANQHKLNKTWAFIVITLFSKVMNHELSSTTVCLATKQIEPGVMQSKPLSNSYKID